MTDKLKPTVKARPRAERLPCGRCGRGVLLRSIKVGAIRCAPCREERKTPTDTHLRPLRGDRIQAEVHPYAALSAEEIARLHQHDAERVARVVASQGPTVTDSELKWGTHRVRKALPRFPYGRKLGPGGGRIRRPRTERVRKASARQRQLAAAKIKVKYAVARLAPRQQEVARLLAGGMTQAAIARQLGMSRKNVHKLVEKVKQHVSRALSAEGGNNLRSSEEERERK